MSVNLTNQDPFYNKGDEDLIEFTLKGKRFVNPPIFDRNVREMPGVPLGLFQHLRADVKPQHTALPRELLIHQGNIASSARA
jgi:hypothetical protein